MAYNSPLTELTVFVSMHIITSQGLDLADGLLAPEVVPCLVCVCGRVYLQCIRVVCHGRWVWLCG